MSGQTMSAVVVALIAVLALVGVLARVLQVSGWQFGGWRTAPRTGRTLIVRESVALDPKRRLHLVQYADRQVILLTGGGQDLVVGWVKDP
jgi:flagellar protein FliO/FliZ